MTTSRTIINLGPRRTRARLDHTSASTPNARAPLSNARPAEPAANHASPIATSLSHSWLIQGVSWVKEYGSTDGRCLVTIVSRPNRKCPQRSASARVTVAPAKTTRLTARTMPRRAQIAGISGDVRLGVTAGSMVASSKSWPWPIAPSADRPGPRGTDPGRRHLEGGSHDLPARPMPWPRWWPAARAMLRSPRGENGQAGRLAEEDGIVFSQAGITVIKTVSSSIHRGYLRAPGQMPRVPVRPS